MDSPSLSSRRSKSVSFADESFLSELTDVTSSFKSSYSDGVRKKRYLSKSMRAGTQFPIRKLHLVMSTVYARRLSKDASVFMAAVLECLVAKVILLAGVIAHNDFRSTISHFHLQMSIRNDKKLFKLLTGEDASTHMPFHADPEMEARKGVTSHFRRMKTG